MGKRQTQNLKRTNLFLVRVWAECGEDESEDSTGSGEVEWHGKVQRVIDGEAHQFANLQSLPDLLLEMLSKGEGES